MTVFEEIVRNIGRTKSSWDTIFLKNMENEIEGTEVTKDVYKKSPIAYDCITYTAKAISQVPLRIEKLRKGKWVPIQNHFWSELLQRPNQTTSSQAFKNIVVTYLLLDGQVGIIPLPLGDPNPAELQIVRKKYFSPKKDEKTNRLLYWEYKPNETSTPIIIDPKEMLSAWFVNPDDPFTGLAPHEVGNMDILIDYKAAYYNHNFFEDGAVPGGILYTDRSLGDKTFERTKAQFESKHQGFKKSHRIALLDQGLKFQQMGLTQKDMEFMNMRKYTREQILMMYGMKSAVLGITKDVNRACIPATERIYTVNRGAISIKDVNENDLVWSMGDNGPEKCRVINSWPQGKKQIYILKTKNHSIRASYDHPILVLNKVYRGELEWKEIGKINEGDFIVTSKGILMEEVESEYSEIGISVQDIMPNMFSIEKVTSVNEDGLEDVYDLEVEDRHNYICNGIVVHNTHKEEMKSWWRDTCLPIMDMVSSEFTFYFHVHGEKKIRFSWDIAAIEALHEDYSDKVKTAVRLWQCGTPLNTLNQVLELGLPEVEGGDVGYLPANMEPLSVKMDRMNEDKKPKEEPVEDEEPEEEPEEPTEEEILLESKIKRVVFEVRKKTLKELSSGRLIKDIDYSREKKLCKRLCEEVNPEYGYLSYIVDSISNTLSYRYDTLSVDSIKRFFNSLEKKIVIMVRRKLRENK